MMECEYCNRPHKMIARTMSIINRLEENESCAEVELHIEDDYINLNLQNVNSSLCQTIDINFCPMCGRKLKEECDG